MHTLITIALLAIGALALSVTWLTLAVNSEANHQDRVSSIPLAADNLDGFLRTLEGAAGETLTQGNRVDVYQNGDAIFPPMLDAVHSARETVHLATYIYWNGSIPDAFTAALVAAAARGVVVRIALDSEGSGRLAKETRRQLTDAGCALVWFRRAQWFDFTKYNRRSHRRLLVVDGRIGFTGGAGIADPWRGNADAPAHWRDTHVRVEGPAVAALQAGFTDTWNLCTGELLLAGRDYPPLDAAGTVRVLPVLSTPTGGASPAQRTYAACIAGATRSLSISNAYFVPTPAFADALVAASRRGVRVTVLVPGPYHNKPAVRRASRHTWKGLLAGGVALHEFQPTMMHAKTMTMDGLIHLVGSINFDPRSLSLNAEGAVLMIGERLAADAESVFAADLARSRRVTIEDVATLGVVDRVLDAACWWLRAQL